MRKPHPRLAGLVAALLLFSVFPIAWLARPVILGNATSICIFRTWTGKPCPFCGLTRAFAHAMHGEFHLAYACHPLWWLAALIVVALGSIALCDAAAGTDLSGRLRWLGRVPVWLLAGVLLLLTLLRVSCFNARP